MSPLRSPALAAGDTRRLKVVAAALFSCLGCSRGAPTPIPSQEASAVVQTTVRVPGALMVARALDALSVTTDPSSVAVTQVPAEDGRALGVEADAFVFAKGNAQPVAVRRAVASGAAFDVVAFAWKRAADGLPLPETKYVVEVRLALFATDAAALRDGDPHGGHYKVLWARTLRQAEE